LRTSVDHGTAFDIAGKNIARDVSMTEAILLAVKYSPAFYGGADAGNLTLFCGRAGRRGRTNRLPETRLRFQGVITPF
jgi:hypothetical protein